MPYGKWQGLQTALPGGLNIANQFQQYQIHQQQMAFNKIKYNQFMQEEERLNKPVRMDMLMSDYGLQEDSEVGNLFKKAFKNIDRGDGTTTMRDIENLNKWMTNDPMMKQGLLNARYKDAEKEYTTLLEEYNTAIRKAKEKGDKIEGDEKIQALKKRRDEAQENLFALDAKRKDVPESYKMGAQIRKMEESKAADLNREIQKLANDLQKIAARGEQQRENIGARGAEQRKTKGTPPGKAGGGTDGGKDTKDMKDYKFAIKKYVDNQLPLPDHLRSFTNYLAWKKSLPGPPKDKSDAASRIFGKDAQASGTPSPVGNKTFKRKLTIPNFDEE